MCLRYFLVNETGLITIKKSKDNSTVSFRTVNDSLRNYFPIPDMNANIVP